MAAAKSQEPPDWAKRSEEGMRRWSAWVELGQPDPNEAVRPANLNAVGLYRPQAGIWCDSKVTSRAASPYVAVGLLHTDQDYPDEVRPDGVVYLYPRGEKSPGRARNETQAVKNCQSLGLPALWISRRTKTSKERYCRWVWVDSWSDEDRTFWLTFEEPRDGGETKPDGEEIPAAPKKSPAWDREELILALDLYVREPSARGNSEHPGVRELSSALNQLPIHPERHLLPHFRNPNGVGLKLTNFMRLDPEVAGTGMGHGGALEEEVWNEFAGDPGRLRRTAHSILVNGPSVPGDLEPEDEDEGDTEGRILKRVHCQRERSKKLPKKKKKQVLRDTGKLACEVCLFEFCTDYGELGATYAECHHTVPVSELDPGQKTKLSDLAILCANCHRLIHRRRPWLTLDELKVIVDRHRPPSST